MTRYEAVRGLRQAGMAEAAVKATVSAAEEAAYTAQHSAQEGPGEYGARDERAARLWERVFTNRINHELSQRMKS